MRTCRPIAAAVVLAAVTALSGCAREPRPIAQDAYDVSGQVNLARTRVAVFINGEQAAEGWLRLPEANRGIGPFGMFSDPAPFPVTGSYRGQPVEVECNRQPLSGEPYCDVFLDGAFLDTLVFDGEGRAG